MTQPESSEEANHFEQVLGRLDALLKRNPTATVKLEDALPVSPTAAEAAEAAEAAGEAEGGDIPVLDEVYEGELPVTSLAEAENMPAPLLTEVVESSGQTFVASGTEQPAEQIGPEAQLPDAYFGRLATLASAETLSPPAAEPVLTQSAPEETGHGASRVDYDALVEQILTSLLPLLQETVARTVEEEIERTLDAIRSGMAERINGEIRESMERELHLHLREMLPGKPVTLAQTEI